MHFCHHLAWLKHKFVATQQKAVAYKEYIYRYKIIFSQQSIFVGLKY